MALPVLRNRELELREAVVQAFHPYQSQEKMTDTYIRKTHFALGALLAALALSAPAAQAAEGRWTQAYGQGNLEYFIDTQGMRLFIGCPTQEGSADAASSVTLMSAASLQEVKKFTIKVGAHTFEGPFEADSRVGENNFVALLNDLRKGDAVVSYGGRTIAFPKSNAAQVLPASGKKGFQCNLG